MCWRDGNSAAFLTMEATRTRSYSKFRLLDAKCRRQCLECSLNSPKIKLMTEHLKTGRKGHAETHAHAISTSINDTGVDTGDNFKNPLSEVVDARVDPADVSTETIRSP